MNSMKKMTGIMVSAVLVITAIFSATPSVVLATGSYVESVDYSYGSDSSYSGGSSSSYVDSVDYTYSSDSSYNGGANSGSCCSQASNSSYVESIDYTYPSTSYSSTPSYVDSIDYTYPSYTSTPSYVESIDYTYPSYSTGYTSYGGTITYGGGGGCSGSCGGSYTPPAPTCVISVNPTSVVPVSGNSVTVTWSSSNASYGTITNIGSVSTSGSRTVYPTQTTTYTGTFYNSYGRTVTCSATVTVLPKPAPTCVLTVDRDVVTAGQSVTVSWSSTNAQYGNITNLGSNLQPSGSHSVQIGQTTTFTGTFYGYDGQSVTCSKTVTVNVQQCPSGYSGVYPNCVPPTQNTPWCTITINNYNYSGNHYYNLNQPVTISWNSSNASYGSVTGIGSVALSGSRTIYPTQTTTYTGTFYNSYGQSATCSVTVYVNNNPYIPPTPPHTPGTPYVTLSAVPYTGLDLGPVGTALYWGFLLFWCALAAYLIVVKRVQNGVYASLKSILFGSPAHTAAPVSHAAPHVAHAAPAPRHEDATDDFILSQINRVH